MSPAPHPGEPGWAREEGSGHLVLGAKMQPPPGWEEKAAGTAAQFDKATLTGSTGARRKG